MHLVCGSAAFLSLIVACFVFGRRFSRSGDRKWSTFSRAAGILFSLALTMSGGHDGSVILYVGVDTARDVLARLVDRVDPATARKLQTFLRKRPAPKVASSNKRLRARTKAPQ